MSLTDIRIGTKITGGYLIICVIILLVGLVGFSGMKSQQKSASIVDAGEKMMLQVRKDMLIIMEMMAATDPGEIDTIWQEHNEAVTAFDFYVDGILQGAELEDMYIYASEDPELLAKVKEADRFHNDHFQPAITRIHELKLQKLKSRNAMQAAMARFENDFERIVAMARELETLTKEAIAGRLATGIHASEIIEKENTWADMAMEIKTSLAMARIAVEEHSQSFETGNLPDIQAEYRKANSELDTWIRALLEGGETGEGRIAPVPDGPIRQLVADIDRQHNDHFQRSGNALLDLQEEIVRVAAELDKLDSDADNTGEKMIAIMTETEHLAMADMHDTVRKANRNILLGIVLGLVFSILLGLFLSRKITAPLRKAVDFAGRLASGDLTATIDVRQKDEVGMMITALNSMVASLRELIGRISEGMDSLASSSNDMAETSQSMASGAEELTAQAATSAAATEQISTNINVVTQTAETMASQSTEIATFSEEMSSNVGSVAAAIEEMSASIQEVAENCSQAQTRAEAARAASQDAGDKMNELDQAAQDIGKVIDVITEITEQTKLLALNATIEAARAGEAGKGFAVVANEVKDLAKQTSDATENISQQIIAIQSRTGGVVADIDKVVEINRHVNDYTNTIAAAVEEQTATTGEIARTVSEVASKADEVAERVKRFSHSIEEEVVTSLKEATSGAAEVSSNIHGVNTVARESSQQAQSIKDSADHLAKLSRDLKEQIGRFQTT